jgi:hypothetical protein
VTLEDLAAIHRRTEKEALALDEEVKRIASATVMSYTDVL